MFITRTISGIVIFLITVASIFAGEWVLGAFTLFISVVGYRELIKCLNAGKGEKQPVTVPECIGYLGIVVYDLLLVLSVRIEWKLFVLAIVFLAMMFAYVILFPKYSIEEMTGYVFSFVYCPVMLAFIYLTRHYEMGHIMVWLIFIASWGCDTCAYLAGMLFGKRKVFPVLSPKKTLAGCIGGVLGSAILGFVYAGFFLRPEGSFVGRENLVLAGICAAGGLMSMVGDLAASAIKRNKGIKDYGKLIPGHGGIMDRFDSVIITAPVVYFLTVLFL